MRFRQIPRMKVILDLEGSKRELGTLAWSREERQAYFEYSAEFIASPMLMSPFMLPVRSGMEAPRKTPDEFKRLHGLFNDSLPDGWGKLLLDRRLRLHGVDPDTITPLDRLSAVGTIGMGALAYIPELPSERHGVNDLDWFVEQVELVQDELDTADIDALQEAQGGSAGARPKIMIGLNASRNSFVIDYGFDLDNGFEPWLVKGCSKEDRRDIGTEEHAYALMARSAGLHMADTMVLNTAKGERLFATKRFDRNQNGRVHMHTAGGLLHASHREPSLDYDALHKMTAMMTRDTREVSQMFRNMTFNVLARNRDDHVKNHAFLMRADGVWKLAPAYDLTFSAGPGGEHSATIAGEGRNPGKEHLLHVARNASISERDALEIIDQVRAAVDNWPKFADEAGLAMQRTGELDRVLNGQRSRTQAPRINATSVESRPKPKKSNDDGYDPETGTGLKPH